MDGANPLPGTNGWPGPVPCHLGYYGLSNAYPCAADVVQECVSAESNVSTLTPNPMSRKGEQNRTEFRERARINLDLEVVFALRSQSRVVRGTTINFGESGFYCVTGDPLPAGVPIDCEVHIPTKLSTGDVLVLRCVIRVVSVERLDGGAEFGLACEIQNYILDRIPHS